jgi:hypothetical protein
VAINSTQGNAAGQAARRRADRLKKEGVLRHGDQGLIVTEANVKFQQWRTAETNVLPVRNSFSWWKRH